MIRKLWMSIVMCLAMVKVANAQMLSANTDLAMDVLQTPSFGMELVVGNHTTLSVNGLANYHPWNSDLQILAVQPEMRYYLSRRPMYHHFVGVCALAASYDITYSEKRIDGYGVGAGITFGYVLPLSSRWNIDFHAGFTMLMYRQREYQEDFEFDVNPYDVTPINAKGYYTLPARVGVSLTYIIN